MNSSKCSRTTRERITNDVRRRLAQHSSFSCSICGAIPIVFHHIEEWSKKFSNDEDLLIPICDKCHRGIHGEGGVMFSQDELYQYKANPCQPLILLDKLPLERKKTYSFFVGSNFEVFGATASIFKFSENHHLISIDTSTGLLKLNVLAGIDDGEATYLIKDNELMIDTQDIWDMRYSRSSLKIWKIIGGKRSIFIDLVIKPDIIIIRRMETTFDGKPFQVRKPRKPQQRQVDKITAKAKECEKLYYHIAAEIDNQPQVYEDTFNGMDMNELVKTSRKNDIKRYIEYYLDYEYCEEFRWPWTYYQLILDQVLSESPIFNRNRDNPANCPSEFRPLYEKIAEIKERYKNEFEEVRGTVAEYGSIVWTGFMNI